LVNPYKDVPFDENSFIRTFSESLDDEELIWHRDKKDREIRVLKGTGWFLQYDNQLPIEMIVGESYFIKAETYHRVIKRQNNLVLEIKEKGV
jgi:quercetin dioxygenase-like cupin family protein